MPNHIRNQIYIFRDDRSQSRLMKIAEFLRCDGKELGSVDFNKLITMPEELDVESSSKGDECLKLYIQSLQEHKKICTTEELARKCGKPLKEYKEMLERGRKYYENIRKYGAPTWYEWCIDHWGTKWNAYDCTPIEQCTDRISFNTAWSSVPKIIEKLSEHFNDQTIAYRWADEDIGYNVGEQIYMNGQVIYENIPAANSKDAYELAADIRGIELSEYGLGYSEESGTYEYRAEAGDVEL